MDEFPIVNVPENEILAEEEYERLYSASAEIIALLSIFYGSISIIAIIGNTLVIWVVATTRQMRTVTNMYIANLALADVTIGLFCIPFQFQAALLQRWNLPDFMCAFCPFVQVVSVNVSVFTLTAIAIDRHRAIINPLRARPTKCISKTIITIIWAISLAFAVPSAIAFRVEVLEERIRENGIIFNVTRPFCSNLNLSDEQLRTYRYLLVFVQYLVPFCVISFVYIQMAVKLWGTRAPGNAQDSRDITLLNNKKKVIKMLIIVVIVFGLCWLPLQTYNILYVTIPEINEYHFINIVWFCCDWLAMSNSCYNPFIYGIYNEKFKREFNKRFSVCFCKFATTLDSHERTMSVHTRASSVRSTYANSSTRVRSNIFAAQPVSTAMVPAGGGYQQQQQHVYQNGSIRKAVFGGGNDATNESYSVITFNDSKMFHVSTTNGSTSCQSNGCRGKAKITHHWKKNNFKPSHGLTSDEVKNTSPTCVCEDELGSRTHCDGSCILNEVLRVQRVPLATTTSVGSGSKEGLNNNNVNKFHRSILPNMNRFRGAVTSHSNNAISKMDVNSSSDLELSEYLPLTGPDATDSQGQ